MMKDMVGEVQAVSGPSEMIAVEGIGHTSMS